MIREQGEVIKMMYDYTALSQRIMEKFITQYNFATAMGLSERSISLKLNNRVRWKDVEISQAVELLEIDIREIPKYFFKHKVHDL